MRFFKLERHTYAIFFERNASLLASFQWEIFICAGVIHFVENLVAQGPSEKTSIFHALHSVSLPQLIPILRAARRRKDAMRRTSRSEKHLTPISRLTLLRTIFHRLHVLQHLTVRDRLTPPETPIFLPNQFIGNLNNQMLILRDHFFSLSKGSQVVFRVKISIFTLSSSSL